MVNARFVNKKVAIIAILAGGLFSAVLVGSMSIASAQQEDEEKPEITGSVNVAEHTRNFINENVKVSFIDAATTAQQQVEGGKVVGGHIGVVQGYLVYTFIVTDAGGQTGYKVIVDVGNGEVLYKSEGHEIGTMMFGHRGFGQGRHFGQAWQMNHLRMDAAN